MLKCKFKSISFSKIGNDKDENEDNILVPTNSDILGESILRFAISDGATESSFSKEWSELLVKSYKEYEFNLENLTTVLNSVSEEWNSIVSKIEMPWYAQQKAENGAFATFLGLRIDTIGKKIDSVAIGDCSFFHIRGNDLVDTFPISINEEFGNTPFLFASNNKHQTDFEKTVKYYEANFEKGDLFILSTDAIANWIFNKIKEDQKPWQIITTLLNSEDYTTDFTNWVKNKIKEGFIKNDDISLVIINFE